MATRESNRPFDRTAAVATLLIAAIGGGALTPVFAQQLPRLPFTATLSNTTPLVFGMGADDAARALGTPLQYISGRPGDEIFLTFRQIGGSGLFPRSDRLFLQFRAGRLTGWKADYGQRWIWR
jgi:hypothetical protein